MENNKISKGENHLIRINSSFDEDINKVDDIFEDKSLHDFEFKFEKEKNLAEKNDPQNIFNNKYFEELELDEINDVINEINKAVTIDINTVNQKDCDIDNNKNQTFINQVNNIINDDHFNVCQEILSILKKPLSNKNVRNRNIYSTPFKPLLKPKKVSMVGKVFFDIPSDNNTKECSNENNNNNANSNINN